MKTLYLQPYRMLTCKSFKTSLLLAGRHRFTIALFVALMITTAWPGKIFAQAPTVSYSGPRTYTGGGTIQPLLPTSSGVAAPGYTSGAITNVGSGFSYPNGVAVDGGGNVYVGDQANKTLYKVPSGGGAVVSLYSTTGPVTGVTVDKAGNVYAIDYNAQKVVKLPVGGGSAVTIGTGFSFPNGLAVDQQGNVYVADQFASVIKMIPAGGGAIVPIGSGFNDPSGVAVDAAGNIYVADEGSSTIKELPAGGGAAVTVSSGFNLPLGVAVDAAGDLYVADSGNNAVKFIPAGSNTAVTIVTGVSHVLDVAVDGAGNVYYSDYTNHLVKKIQPTGGYFITPALPSGFSFNPATGAITGNATVTSPPTIYTITAYNAAGSVSAVLSLAVYPPDPTISYSSPQTFIVNTPIAPVAPASTWVGAPGYGTAILGLGTGFSGPNGVAVDPAGVYVYVADYTGSAIKRMPVGGGIPVVLGSGFFHPTGVAVDAAGNVYVADDGNSAVKEIPAGGGGIITLGSGFSQPYALALDAAGNLYVADASASGKITKILAGGGSQVVLGTGFNVPTGIAVDAAGNVFIADSYNDAIKEIPVGGGSTITIGSGFYRPSGVAVDAIGNLFVADYGNHLVKEIPVGGAPVSIGHGFSGPAGIAVDSKYNVYVADYTNVDVEKIKPAGGFYLSAALPAGLNFSSATGVISGTPTALSPATDYTVTAYNSTGSTPAVVNIRVIANFNLSALAISNGILSPVFAPLTNNYSASVANTITAITLTPTTADAAATVTVNGTAVTSGSSSGPIALNVGANPITVAVTSHSPVATNTYTVTVTRAASSNDNLSGLHLSSGVLSPSFAGGTTTSYTASVANTINSITVTPTTAQPTSTVKVNGTVVSSGAASGAIALSVGSNTITIAVTAQNGVAVKTYTVVVTRAASNNDNLSGLHLSTGALSPAFAAATTGYTALVANTASSITVTPTTAQPTSTVAVDSMAVTSGMASGGIPLAVGSNTITVVVTAQDGVTTKTYTVTVTRAPSTNDNLSALHLSTGALSPSFAAAATSYTASVANTVSSITVTPTTALPTSTVKVNGTTVTSGTASGAIALSVGANTITAVATAQDGVTTKTYTVTVTRAASTNDNLSALHLSNGAVLSPAFAGATTTSYTASVAAGVASITVTPTTAQNTSAVKVNGATVTSGSPSGAIALSTGANTINIVVTAQDGVTTKTYTVTVTRAGGPVNIPDVSLSVETPGNIPQLNDDGIGVHQGLSPNGDGMNDVLTIDGISKYPDNKLIIMSRNGAVIFETKGYNNVGKVFDGHSNKNGKMLLPGTYFYSLDYIVRGVARHKTGFIVLKY